MHIYGCIWESIQNLFSDCRTYFHRCDRIRFLGSSCVNLERTIVSRISCFHIGNNIFCHLIKSLVFIDHNRTDSHNSKYTLQCLYCFIKIIFFRAGNIYTPLLLSYCKFAFYRLQSQFHLFNKCIFKQISVFSFNGDFCIFYQKCMKYHIWYFLLFIFLNNV